MHSLISTVKSISFCFRATHLAKQYALAIETKLPHGEGYIIPSMLWPPPLQVCTSNSTGIMSFMRSPVEVFS